MTNEKNTKTTCGGACDCAKCSCNCGSGCQCQANNCKCGCTTRQK